MTTKSIGIVYAASDPIFPAGTVVASVTVSVTAPDATVSTQSIAADAPTATYEATQVGAYSVTVQAVDGSGAALGAAAVGSFSLEAPATISVSLPVTVTVS